MDGANLPNPNPFGGLNLGEGSLSKLTTLTEPRTLTLKFCLSRGSPNQSSTLKTVGSRQKWLWCPPSFSRSPVSLRFWLGNSLVSYLMLSRRCSYIIPVLYFHSSFHISHFQQERGLNKLVLPYSWKHVYIFLKVAT